MGNTCKGISGDDMEIYTGSGIYKFKKSVRRYDIIIIQRVPRNQDETIYYGKDSNFDKDIHNKIHRTTSLVRNGEQGYRNGNVNVYIPCSEL